MGSLGTSVATETCGRLSVLKFSKTCCEYWICIEVTLILSGVVISIGGRTRNLGTGWPASPVSAGIISGENDSVSEVRFSSRMLSLGGGGGAIGNDVGVVVLSGRKMVLKPLPLKVPAKALSGPGLGTADAAALMRCDWILRHI
jgi:hypothetical protein